MASHVQVRPAPDRSLHCHSTTTHPLCPSLSLSLHSDTNSNTRNDSDLQLLLLAARRRRANRVTRLTARLAAPYALVLALVVTLWYATYDPLTRALVSAPANLQISSDRSVTLLLSLALSLSLNRLLTCRWWLRHAGHMRAGTPCCCCTYWPHQEPRPFTRPQLRSDLEFCVLSVSLCAVPRSVRGFHRRIERGLGFRVLF